MALYGAVCYLFFNYIHSQKDSIIHLSIHICFNRWIWFEIGIAQLPYIYLNFMLDMIYLTHSIEVVVLCYCYLTRRDVNTLENYLFLFFFNFFYCLSWFFFCFPRSTFDVLCSLKLILCLLYVALYMFHIYFICFYIPLCFIIYVICLTSYLLCFTVA